MTGCCSCEHRILCLCRLLRTKGCCLCRCSGEHVRRLSARHERIRREMSAQLPARTTAEIRATLLVAVADALRAWISADYICIRGSAAATIFTAASAAPDIAAVVVVGGVVGSAAGFAVVAAGVIFRSCRDVSTW